MKLVAQTTQIQAKNSQAIYDKLKKTRMVLNIKYMQQGPL